MFGRIRAPPSPAEWLELERQPSKHFKDDSLSVFEATLLKLKQGSQRSLSSEHESSLMASQDLMDFESNGNVSEDSSKVPSSCSEQGTPASCCASSDSSSASGSSSSLNQEPKRGREVSIQFLFSRYNSSHQKQGSASPCHEYGVVERHTAMNCTDSSSDSEIDQGSEISI